ncbi:MAG: hypothetical protein U0K04_07105 [Faecalibacterium prausnitzii]|nr:hypothetical protein [Faecalibacterium prausnitzii]
MESIAQKIIYEIFFGDHKVSADLQVPDTVLMDAPYHAGLAFEAQEICGQAFPGMAVRFAEKSYSAREKAPEDCFGHLFRRFLPILQCFLQKRLYK